MSFTPLGHITVEPALPVLMGSNVTVVCHITAFQMRQEWLDISLELQGKPVDWLRLNRTTVQFTLHNVSLPKTFVLCTLRVDQRSQVVNGLLLQAGLAPDKPGNISCETTRSSAVLDCAWTTGCETYVETFYNVTIHRENGAPLHFHQGVNNVTVSRGTLDEDATYLLTITAYNVFGASRSDPFSLCTRDSVIPETPRVTQVDFNNDSSEVTLGWETSEPSSGLQASVRLRSHDLSWAVREGMELGGGLIRVHNLRPLTEYEFQIRMCVTHSSIGSGCSRWSRSLKKTSPGKGPTHRLDVWRVLGSRVTGGMQAVTLLWKPPPPEDYSGALQRFRIRWASDREHEVTCSGAVTQWSGHVPSAVHTLTVSAVTSYGTSPPADVPLTHSDVRGPVLTDVTSTSDGRAVLVSWSSWSWFGDESELLYYVLEWTCVPAGGVQWKKLSRDIKNTSITGLTAGVRYNVSLHVVTTRGLSAPSSRLIYCRESAPVSGPNMSVLTHETKRVLVQWDELPVEQQRGFITKYTVYIQSLDDVHTQRNVTVSASHPRRMWLDCPEGAVTLRMSASTSAGEGPPGRRTFSQPDAAAVDLVIVVVFIIAVFIAVLANLMCWSCVRKRVKQACLSLGLQWLVENLPKPDHSNAIRLVQETQNDGSCPPSAPLYSDPPLSSVTEIPLEERDNIYPTIHVEESQTGWGPTTQRKTSLSSDILAVLVGSRQVRCEYKPHFATTAGGEEGEPEVKDAEEKQSDAPADQEDDRRPRWFDELLRGPLLGDEVDFSYCSSVAGLLRPTTTETSVFRGGVVQETRPADSSCTDPKQEDSPTPDTTNTSWSESTSDMTGYLPQVASPLSDTLR